MKNSPFGRFIDEGLTYQITEPDTPRPLINYMWNERFLSGVNHFGGGDGAYGKRAACYIDSDNRGRATLIRSGNRYFYLKNTESGSIWNPGWYPSCMPLSEYSCKHTPGSTCITGVCDQIRAELQTFVPELDPCEVWTVTIENQSLQPCHLQLYSFVEFCLEGYSRYSEYESYVYTRYLSKANMIYAHNDAQERPHSWYDGYIACTVKPNAFETSTKRFLGTYGNISRPEQVVRGNCSSQNTACEDMAGVLMYDFLLQGGEKKSFTFLIGSSNSEATALETANRIFSSDVGQMRQTVIKKSQERNRLSQIISPEPRLNCVFNNWLKQQVAMCTEIGRSTGKGFRDTLQDAMALCTFNPELAKNKIFETLRHQYSDGRCPRGWLPLDPHIYSDGPTWIAPAVNAYLKSTGDFSILEETVPYLDKGAASVWEHILCAARYSSNDLGDHHLILAHDGDWNDSLNGIGVAGRGESVWTSIAMYQALGETLEMAREFYAGDTALHSELEQYRDSLRTAVQHYGWDGHWFLAGYTDAGAAVGSHTEAEGKIYLNPQTWAVLSDIAAPEQKEKCLRALDTYLESENGPLTLFPPYTTYQQSIGRLTGFVPGIWENGTPYCHGGMFKVVMDLSCGRENQGWDTLLKILPDSPGNPSWQSGCEPYVFTNMYMGPDNPRKGESDFAWVTGTAGWALRAVEQYLYGFCPSYRSIELRPHLPQSFAEGTLIKKFRDSWYYITYKRGTPKIIFDGIDFGNVSVIPILPNIDHHDVVIYS